MQRFGSGFGCRGLEILRRIELGGYGNPFYTVPMVIVTGGAGFIGSCLVSALKQRGERVVVIDRLRDQDKWRNLAKHPPEQLIAPEQLDAYLETKPSVRAVFHLGAISSTIARNGDLVWQTNVALSTKLLEWCTLQKVPFIYASSAATYGAASSPKDFSDAPESLESLRPLNLYGWSKHVFDCHIRARQQGGSALPPQCVGLKFFNVYGPNEYHKGGMISVVKVKYDEIKRGMAPRLFRSDQEGQADGAQTRDFIWVEDVIDVLLWLYDHPHVSGLFNCGTGVSRSYLDLAYAVCDAAHVSRDVSFINMPDALRGQYQSFTCADMRRLRAAGYANAFTTLEEGITRYVHRYLAGPDLYL